MGVDCSCFRGTNHKTSMIEMDLTNKFKQQSECGNELETTSKSIIIINNMLLPRRENYLLLKTLLRGYLHRKVLEDRRDALRFKVQDHYSILNKPITFKEGHAVKTIEKIWGTYLPRNITNGGVKVTRQPAVVLKDGSLYDGE